MLKNDMINKCSGCLKCCKVCPANIDITAMLEIYKRYLIDGTEVLDDLTIIESIGKSEDCIECGACTSYCPRNIDLKEIIRNMAMLQFANYSSCAR